MTDTPTYELRACLPGILRAEREAHAHGDYRRALYWLERRNAISAELIRREEAQHACR